MVSVALRTSAEPMANGSPPAEPPPMVVYTLFTYWLVSSRARACSATCSVSLSVLPGGSSRYTWVCELSSGGMKPVGSSGTSAIEPTKNSSAPIMVTSRWRTHQLAQRS